MEVSLWGPQAGFPGVNLAPVLQPVSETLTRGRHCHCGNPECALFASFSSSCARFVVNS